MRILVVAWALVFCASAQAQQVGSLISGEGTVVDGDTFDIRRDRIRIWGIDAPEGRHGCVRGGMKWWPAGDATAALKDCPQYTTVTCRVQKIQRRWLRVRYVSECWRNDTKEDIGACMVSSGWATDYPGYSGGHYAPLEAAPKAAKRGLWQCEDRPPTVRWCKRGNGTPCERPIYKPSGPG
jgi:endonuclease YncB( thermonuclease family)